MGRAAAFAQRLGLPIRDLDLLEQSLVHSSYLHEHPDAARGHNERLEFLGDAVVSLAISDAVYARHPDDDEGILSARRAAIVSTSGLSRLAGRFELGELLLLGEGEAARGARRRPSLLASSFEASSDGASSDEASSDGRRRASSFEAVIGAVYLDLGWEATRHWLVQLAAPELDHEVAVGTLKSPKSRLQEHTQRTAGRRPTYRVLDAVGPDHDKMFSIEVSVEGDVLGRGEGPSRRVAETAAAAQALDTLRARRERERERADADAAGRSA